MGKKYFFDKSERVKRLFKLFYASLIMLVIADFFVPKHPAFAWEGFPSFYGAYGFMACAVLVLAARFVLRKLVMRKENYYDR